MCQSKEQGGRRCEHANTSSKNKSNLKDLIRYHSKQGHDEKVTELQDTLTNIEQAEAKYGKCVSPFAMELTPETEELISSISKSGYDPLIVGGSVRDVLYGSDSKDIDIEVYGGNIADISASLKAEGYKVDEVGKSFGVLKTTLKNGEDIDISVPRTESKAGTGHKGFEVVPDETLTVEEASSRRDFTINSMMYSHENGVIIDPHQGKADFDNQTLRHVSDAFADDPLRVMRGFQFASRFDTNMAEETTQMCEKLLPESGSLAEERMKTEWDKFYTKGVSPAKGMEVLHNTKWDTCYKGLREANTEEMRESLDNASALTRDEPAETKRRVQSAVIASYMNEEDAKEFTSRTNTLLKEGNQAYALSQTQERGQIKTDTLTLANDLDKNKTNIKEWSLVQKAKGRDVESIVAHASREGVLTSAEPPMLSGGQIIEHSGRQPGKWAGEVQREFKAAQANREFSTKKEAKEWVDRRLLIDDPSSLEGKIVMTHGLPASGKSSWSNRLHEAHSDKVVILNRDTIREEKFGKEYHESAPVRESELEVTKEVDRRLRKGVKEGKVVVLDNTNLNNKTVMGYRSDAEKLGTSTEHIYFPTDIDECKRRNLARERQVPEGAYDSMIKRGFNSKGEVKRIKKNSRGEMIFS